jgi:hypothetical protein
MKGANEMIMRRKIVSKVKQLASTAAAAAAAIAETEEHEDSYKERVVDTHGSEFSKFYRTCLLGVIIADAIENQQGVRERDHEHLAANAYNLAVEAMHMWAVDWTHVKKEDKVVEQFNKLAME